MDIHILLVWKIESVLSGKRRILNSCKIDEHQLTRNIIIYFITFIFVSLGVGFGDLTPHPRRPNTTANITSNTIKSEKPTVPQIPRSSKTKHHKDLTSRPTLHLTLYPAVLRSTPHPMPQKSKT